MRLGEVKTVLTYYRKIPAMARILRQERKELEEAYNSLGAAPIDGMPHGRTLGRPTERLGLAMAGIRCGARLQEIAVELETLEGDAAAIRVYLDALNGEYKRLVLLRYVNGYSWARISVSMEAPDSTVRYWHKKALERLGEVLEEAPMAGELLGRASRART